MALNNFANLKASIKQRSQRDDVSDADLNDYVLQAESEFHTAGLRVRAMEALSSVSASTSDRFLALPTGFLSMRAVSLVLSSGNEDVKYMPPELMAVDGTSGKPKFFTVTTRIEFDKVPDDTYTVEMRYIGRITALSDAAPTNTILTDAPNVYLFGSLWALFQEKQDIELAEYYYSKFINAINGYNRTDNRGRYGPAPKMRIEGATP